MTPFFARFFAALGYLPTVILRGPARGCLWSMYPYSSYWRHGGNDPAVDATIAKLARERRVFWDIGAHYGIYSFVFARIVGAQARVESFEPDPVSARRLRWHRFLNHTQRITIHPVAVSAENKSTRMYHYSPLGATTMHLPFQGETLEGVPYIEVQTVRLDDWVKAGRIHAPDLIKLDVEGHAVEALDGMRETLRAALPAIVLAVHHEKEWRGSIAILSSLGYRTEPAADNSPDLAERDYFGEIVCLPPTEISTR